jgi:hypothetical protein
MMKVFFRLPFRFFCQQINTFAKVALGCPTHLDGAATDGLGGYARQ